MHQDRSSPTGSTFWRDAGLPFIEARAVTDGRRVCYARHSHETFSIGLVDSGMSTYLNRGHQCRIEAGTLVLMNPGDVHACNPIDNRPWAYRMLYIDAAWLGQLQRAQGRGDGAFCRFAPILTRDPQLQAGFCRLHAALVDESADNAAKETAVVAFFNLLHRQLPMEAGGQDQQAGLSEAARLITENHQRGITLQELCAKAGVSPSSLIRSFKKQFGMTPHAYLTNRRVQFARSELRRGTPIAEAALAAGFADQAHLQRVFKQLLAATPGHYRGKPHA